ncbi:acylphosphatase [Coriobacteriia bacterium Es71-Z0120]|uniref:acylphosphatase n=1 Tax=Parvivirga hydrogeniphila TaxID=2939460 RepID=UPI002260CC51|nr:acylphosphatase [Parvivirga hydrogeniphila]MCL4078211.1 acylphosphatase [Parvivirga hydrogeniphila]
METVHVHVWVSGVVQGVFYRAATVEQARAAGVAGWVRNLPDGRVEAVLEGPRDAVERVLAWMRIGPPRAVVDRVEVASEPVEGLAGFSVR